MPIDLSKLPPAKSDENLIQKGLRVYNTPITKLLGVQDSLEKATAPTQKDAEAQKAIPANEGLLHQAFRIATLRGTPAEYKGLLTGSTEAVTPSLVAQAASLGSGVPGAIANTAISVQGLHEAADSDLPVWQRALGGLTALTGGAGALGTGMRVAKARGLSSAIGDVTKDAKVATQSVLQQQVEKLGADIAAHKPFSEDYIKTSYPELHAEVTKNPGGKYAQQIWGEKGKPNPKSIADKAEALRKEREAGAVQTARNENAREKFVEKTATQESKNLNAADKFVEKSSAQEAKNLNAADKFRDKDIARTQKDFTNAVNAKNTRMDKFEASNRKITVARAQADAEQLSRDEAVAAAKRAAAQQAKLDELKAGKTALDPAVIRERIKGQGDLGPMDATIIHAEPPKDTGSATEVTKDLGLDGKPPSEAPVGPATKKGFRKAEDAQRAADAAGGAFTVGKNPNDNLHYLIPEGQQPPWLPTVGQSMRPWSGLTKKEQEALKPLLQRAIDGGVKDKDQLEHLGDELANRLGMIKDGRDAAEDSKGTLDAAIDTIKKSGRPILDNGSEEIKNFRQFLKKNGVSDRGLFTRKNVGRPLDQAAEDVKNSLPGFKNNKETALLDHLQSLSRPQEATPVEELIAKHKGNWWQKPTAEVTDYTQGDVPTLDVEPPAPKVGDATPTPEEVAPQLSEASEPADGGDISFNPAELEAQAPPQANVAPLKQTPAFEDQMAAAQTGKGNPAFRTSQEPPPVTAESVQAAKDAADAERAQLDAVTRKQNAPNVRKGFKAVPPAAEPAPEAPSALTPEERKALRKYGYSDKGIDSVSPEDARSVLRNEQEVDASMDTPFQAKPSSGEPNFDVQKTENPDGTTTFLPIDKPAVAPEAPVAQEPEMSVPEFAQNLSQEGQKPIAPLPEQTFNLTGEDAPRAPEPSLFDQPETPTEPQAPATPNPGKPAGAFDSLWSDLVDSGAAPRTMEEAAARHADLYGKPDPTSPQSATDIVNAASKAEAAKPENVAKVKGMKDSVKKMAEDAIARSKVDPRNAKWDAIEQQVTGGKPIGEAQAPEVPVEPQAPAPVQTGAAPVAPVKPTKFPKSLQDEINYRHELAKETAAENGTPEPQMDDAHLAQIFQDMENSDAGLGKWKKPIRQWMVDKNIYKEVSPQDVANTTTMGNKSKGFEKLGDKTIEFNQWPAAPIAPQAVTSEPARFFKSPLEAAGPHYGELKEAAKMGEVPDEAARVAGRAASRLNREDIAAKAAAEKAAQIQATKAEIEDPATPPLHREMLKRWLSEQGATSIPLAFRMTGGMAGAATGYATDPLGNRPASAVAGGALGAFAPEIASSVGNIAIPKIAQAGQKSAPYTERGLDFINRLHNSALLSPLSVAKKAAGDVGGLSLAAIENPNRVGDIMRQFTSPEGRALLAQNFREGYHGPDQEALSGLENFFQSKKNPLSWSGRTMGGLTKATKGVLGEAGFSVPEQQYYTLTAYPEHLVTKKIYEALRGGSRMTQTGEPAKGSKILSHLAPFARIGTNRLERGWEYSPLGLTSMITAGGDEEKARKIVTKAMLGTAAGGAAYQLTPEDFVRDHPTQASVISSLGGPLGLPILAGMALKTANKNTADNEGPLSWMGNLNQASQEIGRDIPGLRLLEDVTGRSFPKGFARNYFSGYTNFMRPMALMTDPEQPDVSSPDLSTTGQVFNQMLSNVPVVRGMLPRK
jgi:hypothetical protein